MCDKIIKNEVPQSEIPQYVYKVVQKVGNGKYVTPVMGEPLYKGSWKKAPKLEQPKWSESLIKFLTTKFKSKSYASSSVWAEHHVGRWGSFKNKMDAKEADLASNFLNEDDDLFDKVIVKCEIKGDVSASKFSGYYNTFLSTHIRVVEEV